MNTKDQQTLFLAMAELAKVERAARVRQLAGVREWRRRKMAARVRLPLASVDLFGRVQQFVPVVGEDDTHRSHPPEEAP